MISNFIITLLLQFCFSAKLENNTLVVSVDGHMIHYFFPIDMEESNNYIVQIPRSEFTDFKEMHNQVWSNKMGDMQLDTNKEKILEKVDQLINLANTQYNEKLYAKALESISDALIMDPMNFILLTMKGSALYKLGEYPSAITYWNKSLTINPLQPDILRFIQKAKDKQK